MEDCKGASTPIPLDIKLERPLDNCNHSLPYQQLIGGLMQMHLTVCTRPDITYVTGMLSQFNSYHNEDHWNVATKGILKYLRVHQWLWTCV